MLFNSFNYLVFLPLIAALYFLMRPRFRWILMLGASYYFYMSWRAEYAILILFCTAINYLAAILIDRTAAQPRRKLILIIDLVLSFGVLFFYKYLGFLTGNVNAALHTFNATFSIPTFEILLPVGISFFTFQTLSYTIDVYRGKTKVERHFGIFALFVSFFPQLVAGPIERSENLLPQIRKLQYFDIARVTGGLRIILWGLFKKVVIADRLSVIVNTVYNNLGEHGGAAIAVATVAFAFQIYGDFSGYSDIALGSARIFGIDLMQNFDKPYFSKSTGEFWRRWHISLSSWFRDYVYIPLGGSRVSRPRYYLNNMITFAASGLWHGANWTFVIWGLLNGLYTSIGSATRKLRARASGAIFHNKAETLHKIIQIAITFSLITFSWIFFRANNVEDAIYVITHIFPLDIAGISSAASAYQLVCAGAFVLILGLTHYFGRCENRVSRFFYSHRSFRYACYISVFALILMFGVTGNETAFIYFQF
ncbi:MAG: MBOAT family O-acyltransferase [Clostridia bacterium]